ncbi:Lysosomal alpha-mannosidase [Hypsibius exemplaris]|uniref:Alpha-mannosidase n=1 Tax=Hypsibius exemplaris TaxID=2072580 RepID=A0A1W0WMT5_HYPEX|nr:Lysosomal alpha-mannosidase [Hypsibius exemplaris]
MHVLKLTLIIGLAFVIARTDAFRRRGNSKKAQDSSCSYKSCGASKPGLLNVHVVAHTHDDVGWLKTVDQYYYGAKNDIQFAGVQYILDSVVDALNRDPARKFIYVETAFFWRWWQEQSTDVQTNVQELVNQGRLTFINGGWSMNDEATTHYSSIIENFAWGLRRLNDNFGTCGRPTVGWQIDPFGHSREHATILSQMGFDGLFLGRVDYQDKSAREKNRKLEMIWETSPNLGDPADLFTGILPNGYSPPSRFCFDATCQDTPFMDDHRREDYNVDQMVQLFIAEMNDQATKYATSELIVTMGDDFNYQNADMWFKNLDKLIKYVNAQQENGSKINLLYSTPACYLYALNQAGATWSTKTDDFFPYGSGEHSYWTGYFTSRPTVKRFERVASSFLNTCKQISTIAKLDEQTDKITELREALGVAQHHDAVAGTEKQVVAFDYALQLDQGVKSCQDVVGKGLSKLANISPKLSVQYCDLVNISQCAVTEQNKDVTLLLWNPLARAVEKYIHIPVSDGDYSVTGSSGNDISIQINPIFQPVIDIPGRKSTATQEIVFLATLAPLDYTAINIKRASGKPSTRKGVVGRKGGKNGYDSDVVFQNDFISVTFDQDSGILKSITNVETKDVTVISQTFNTYTGLAGDNSNETKRASGAYIFRPNCTDMTVRGKTICIAPFSNSSYQVVQGTLVQELRQTVSPWVSQIVRLYANSPVLEFEWQIGPIPVNDGVGKEIISLFRSDLNSNQTFFTDTNGREMLQRKRNSRPTFDLNNTEPVAGNYYPVNSRIFIQDETKGTQLTLLTDRTQGGTSLNDGELELMVHRRLLFDDGLGVGEPLNESSYGTGLVARGKHYLLFTKIPDAAKAHRLAAQEIYWQPEIAFVANSDGTTWWKDPRKPKIQTRAPVTLPDNVHILSLEQWTNNTLIVRLEHTFEQGEDPVLSLPATVDLQSILGDLKIKSIVEVTIDGNAPVSAINRLKWKKAASPQRSQGVRRPMDGSMVGDAFSVTLNSMEIRSFQVTLSL